MSQGTLLASFFIDVVTNSKKAEKELSSLANTGKKASNDIHKSFSESFNDNNFNFKKPLVDVFSGITSAITKVLKIGIGTAVGLLATSTTSLIATTKKSVEEFARYQQAEGGALTLFGDDNGKAVIANAKAAFEEAQISTNDYLEQVTSFSASLIQSLDGNREKAVGVADLAVKDMSDNANKMGTNISEIQRAYQGFAKNNYTMLDNLKLGFGGTKKEMERLLETASKLSGKTFEMDNFADMVEAIHIIQKDLKITGTSIDEANNTIEGSLNALKASWTNWLAGIADNSQDHDALTKDLVERAKIFGEQAIPAAKTAILGIANAIKENKGLISEGITSFVVDILPDVMDASGIVVDAIVDGIGMCFTEEERADFLAKGLTNLLIKSFGIGRQVVDNLALISNAALERLFIGLWEGAKAGYWRIEYWLQDMLSAAGTKFYVWVDRVVERIQQTIQKITGLFDFGGSVDYNDSALGGIQNAQARQSRLSQDIHTTVELDGKVVAKSVNGVNKRDRRAKG